MNKEPRLVDEKQLCNLAFYPELVRTGFVVLDKVQLPINNYVFFEGLLKDGYFQLLRKSGKGVIRSMADLTIYVKFSFGVLTDMLYALGVKYQL